MSEINLLNSNLTDDKTAAAKEKITRRLNLDKNK